MSPGAGRPVRHSVVQLRSAEGLNSAWGRGWRKRRPWAEQLARDA